MTNRYSFTSLVGSLQSFLSSYAAVPRRQRDELVVLQPLSYRTTLTSVTATLNNATERLSTGSHGLPRAHSLGACSSLRLGCQLWLPPGGPPLPLMVETRARSILLPVATSAAPRNPQRHR